MGVIRKTQSVKILLDEFEKKSSAISAIALIKGLNSKLNKTTIYRVLDKLEDDKVLHSFLGADGIKWYAKCDQGCKSGHKDTHPHFQCLDCGKVDCLTMDINIPQIPNRKIISTQLLIQGICDDCLLK